MGEWWQQAKGTLIKNNKDFENYMNKEGAESFVVVDFYMPACGWCQKFMPEWNQVVEDISKAANGEVKFIKIDGTVNRQLAQRYDVQSFPTFIIITPGTAGMEYLRWKVRNRTYDGLIDFINDYVTMIKGT